MSRHRGTVWVSGWIPVVFGALALAVSGCGGGPPGASLAPSETRARELVSACLEAWKDGGADGLSGRQPPIRFTDPDLAAKSSLVGYSIGASGRSFGHVVELPARLEVKDRRGRTRSVEAAYQVAVEPGAAVHRVEPGD